MMDGHEEWVMVADFLQRGMICYCGEKGEETAATMDGPRRRRATISHDGWPMIGGKAIIS